MLTLYSGSTCPFSHRCRIVLYEKDMDFEIIDVDNLHKPEDLAVLNPYNEVPVLVERDLILYEAGIISEYIDERFPHPQLMPADPVTRAKARLLLFRFEQELFLHVKTLENMQLNLTSRKRSHAREVIRQSLTMVSPMFTAKQYVFGDELSMVDITMATLLWRLEHYQIKINKNILGMLKYADRLFQRKAFLDSLTAAERAMHH
ncbi:MAG: glutathione S-transferase N-terminal domain-containing protein [Neisseriales bacterium]|nr:MAG: glutathione S-transferase N-terminal domain-containing protein [Neisseriales bacterium]